MGMFGNIRNFFGGSKDTSAKKEEDFYKKSSLVSEVINLIDKIKRINSFDSSIWNLSNETRHTLQNKSLDELERIKDNLTSRMSEITSESQRRNPEMEALEASKWTGQKPQKMSAYDFDRFQRDDGR